VNTLGQVVGQLVGNCVTVQSSAAIAASYTVCLPLRTDIAVNSAFTTYDFATQATNIFTPMGTVATQSSDLQSLCAVVSSAGSFCPITRYLVYASSVTSADTSCPELNTLATTVQNTQVALGLTTAAAVPLDQQNLLATLGFITQTSSNGTVVTPVISAPASATTAAPVVGQSNKVTSEATMAQWGTGSLAMMAVSAAGAVAAM